MERIVTRTTNTTYLWIMVNIPEATKMLEAIHQLGQMPMDSNSLIRDNRINIFHQ